MMKKSLVALAAVAAVSAYAQTTVTLSGRASMDVSTWGASGSFRPAEDFSTRTRVADTSSRITFSVMEDLGGGMRSGVFCETGFSIDTATANGQANTANAASSEWCSREGRLFIGNDTVELRLGRQNVWWTQGQFNDNGSNHLGSDVSSNLFNGAMGAMVTTRGENMIKLAGGRALGAFNGSEAYMGYQTNYENTLANINPGTANTTSGGTYQGFKLNFDQGGRFLAAVDYQNSTNSGATVGTVSSFDRTATRYSLGFRYAAGSMASFQYWNKERTDKSNASNGLALPGITTNNTSTTNTGSGKDSGYVLSLKHVVTPQVTAFANYTVANNMFGPTGAEVSDSGAVAYTLGGTYRLSKRSHVYGAMHQIRNGIGAAYGMSGGNYQSGTNGAGSTVNVTALGLQHNF
jgi:predicted porin